MTNKNTLYQIPKSLDAPIRIVMLTIGEFVPAVTLLIVFFIQKKIILAIIAPTLVVVLLKYMKQGQGAGWLLNLCYWYLPKCIMACLLQHTPPSCSREYIA